MNEIYVAEFSDTTGAVVEKFFSSYDAAIKWARAKAKGSDDLMEESYAAKDGSEITEVSWSTKYSGFLVAKDREIGYTVTVRKAMPFEVPEDFAARHAAAASLGRAGGQAKTAAKATASRANGKRGGRPFTFLPISAGYDFAGELAGRDDGFYVFYSWARRDAAGTVRGVSHFGPFKYSNVAAVRWSRTFAAERHTHAPVAVIVYWDGAAVAKRRETNALASRNGNG